MATKQFAVVGGSSAGMTAALERKTRGPVDRVSFQVLRLGASAVIVLATACGAPPAPTPGKGHAHAQGHGPLVHRFEHAEQWALEFDDPARDAWQRPKDVIDAMEIQPGMTVADIGAGTGYFEPWLSRAVGETGTVLALDVEPDMVRYLNERVAREHLANVRPSLVPMDGPNLPAGGVDRILIVDTWHHIPDREAYAAKLQSGLKVGGKVFVVDFKLDAKHGPPPQHRLTAEQVARELTAGGLPARVVPMSLPEQYIVVGARP
jgi:SAM-dependent methyltransferase